MKHDSRHVAQELNGLKQRVLTMAEAAEERLRTVLHALVERDDALLADVIGGDARINAYQIEIDKGVSRCSRYTSRSRGISAPSSPASK